MYQLASPVTERGAPSDCTRSLGSVTHLVPIPRSVAERGSNWWSAL